MNDRGERRRAAMHLGIEAGVIADPADEDVSPTRRIATPIDGVPIVRRLPSVPPPSSEEQAIATVARSISRIKIAIVVILIPIVMTAKLAISHLYERAEIDTVAKIERARLLEDVRDFKARDSDQRDKIRDMQEELRRHALRIEDLLQDRRKGTP